ncbi:MAG: hypothetical protein IT169_05145 [Bryobacterales bacterium]|nr:hypothetical protein [Bryobacterales bacterium]
MARFPRCDRHNRSAGTISVFNSDNPRHIAAFFENRNVLAQHPLQQHLKKVLLAGSSPLKRVSRILTNSERLSSGSDPENPEIPDKTVSGLTLSIQIT